MSKDKDGNWFKRHKILTVVLVIIVIAIAVNAGSGDKSKTNNTANNSQPAKTENKQTTAKIGEAARDGRFEFTVASIKCGETTVGDQYLTKQAQGQFCLVDMTVKNIGNEAQLFDSSSQYLFDAGGAKYSADGSASIYANPQGSTFLNQINPGNSVTGKVVFDVPKDKTPTTAELHDSAFSGGIKVNLQ